VPGNRDEDTENRKKVNDCSTIVLHFLSAREVKVQQLQVKVYAGFNHFLSLIAVQPEGESVLVSFLESYHQPPPPRDMH